MKHQQRTGIVAILCAGRACLVCLLLLSLSTNAAAPKVAAGAMHTLTLKNSGTLVAMGDDSHGQLGLGRSLQFSTPLQITGLTQVRMLAVGQDHTIAVKQEGTVWAWGANDSGQLGDGGTANRSVPRPVEGLTGAAAAAAGAGHSVALKEDGTVWAWGANWIGQLGDGTTGYHRSVPTLVAGMTGVIAVTANWNYTLALKQDGTVWGWGSNTYGELGDGTTTDRSAPAPVAGLSGVIAISAGPKHAVAVKQDGTVWTWGANDFSQLGRLSSSTCTNIGYSYPCSTVPMQVQGISDVTAIATGHGYTDVLRHDGTVWAWGDNRSSGEPVQLPGISSVTAISAGYGHTVAKKQDGTLLAWGWNDSGQLGDGTTIGRAAAAPVPGLSGVAVIAAGGWHTVALKQDGSVWAWGKNYFGELGVGTITSRSTPAQVVGLGGVIAVALGKDHTVALKEDGTVWTWGQGLYSQLGDGSSSDRSTPGQVPGLSGVLAIATGSYHTIVLKQDGTLLAWGGNSYGELGDDTTTSRGTPGAVVGLTAVSAIAAGVAHTVALKPDGTVWAWGSNHLGQLGAMSGSTCTIVGDPLPCSKMPIQVVGISGVIAIAASGSYSLALKDDGTVWGWGANDSGQLGDTPNSTCTFSVPCLRAPAQVPGISGVTAIAAGDRYAVALKQDGTVWAWGANDSGQLGDGTFIYRRVPAPVSSLTGIAAIAAGSGHSIGLKQDGTVWTWGNNFFGQLGDGTYELHLEPVLVVNETINGPLDLIPEVPNNISPDKIPPFFVASYKSGDLSALTLSADIRGITPIGALALASSVGPLAAGGYNVYVAASVPNGASYVFYQLDSSNRWSALAWPMTDFMRGVELGSQDALIRVNILQNVDLSPYIGTLILVGYGTDPDEMLANSRYRSIFTVTEQ